jgi:phosphohistidine phosphatase
MHIYLVQHGAALPKDVDEQRPLSKKGRNNLHKVASVLKKKEISITKICHSGKLRARETAEIFGAVLGITDIAGVRGMNPNDDVRAFCNTLTEYDVMYVGHLPHLQRVVSYLVVNSEDADVLRFSNGGIVCIENSGNHSEILWHLTPNLC